MTTPPRTPSSTQSPEAIRAAVADRPAPLADAAAFAAVGARSPRPGDAASPPLSPSSPIAPPEERAARRRTAWRWAAAVALTALALSAVPHPAHHVVQPSAWPDPELQRAHPTEVADRQGFGLPFTTVTVQRGPSRQNVEWRTAPTFGDGVAGALGLLAVGSWWRGRRRRRPRATGSIA